MTCIVRKEIRLNEKSTPELASEVDCGADGTLTYTIKKSHKFAIY